MLRKQRKRVTTVLNDLLACPRCDKALDAVSAGWRCGHRVSANQLGHRRRNGIDQAHFCFRR
jgi:hypothetical protein